MFQIKNVDIFTFVRHQNVSSVVNSMLPSPCTESKLEIFPPVPLKILLQIIYYILFRHN